MVLCTTWRPCWGFHPFRHMAHTFSPLCCRHTSPLGIFYMLGHRRNRQTGPTHTVNNLFDHATHWYCNHLGIVHTPWRSCHWHGTGQEDTIHNYRSLLFLLHQLRTLYTSHCRLRILFQCHMACKLSNWHFRSRCWRGIDRKTFALLTLEIHQANRASSTVDPAHSGCTHLGIFHTPWRSCHWHGTGQEDTIHNYRSLLFLLHQLRTLYTSHCRLRILFQCHMACKLSNWHFRSRCWRGIDRKTFALLTLEIHQANRASSTVCQRFFGKTLSDSPCM